MQIKKLTPHCWVMRAVLFMGLTLHLAVWAETPVRLEARRVEAETLHRQPLGQPLQLRFVTLAPNLPTVDLELERFEVFAPDAQFTVYGDKGAVTKMPPPKIAAFRGQIRGNESSHAFVIADEAGDWRGIVGRADGIYVLEKPVQSLRSGGQPVLTVRKTQASDFAGREFKCEVDQLDHPEPTHAGHSHDHAPDFQMGFKDLYAEQPSEMAAVADNGVTYKVRVALETDHEFYQLFNDTTAAQLYLASLFGYVSTVYQNQINTVLEVGDVFLHATPNDPWTVLDSPLGALIEFQDFWNANRTGVNRTIANLVSGKFPEGGIAYIGVLCNASFGYGFTGGMVGEFNPNNPQVVWDAATIAHEIGHNFSAIHTHCYGGIGGNASPIDGCYGGETSPNSLCHSGPEALPGPSSLTGGTSGAGNGTIMSYCHRLQGGMSNISMSLGANLGFGVAPERVPQQMRAFVESLAAQQPRCIVPVTATFPIETVANPANGGTVNCNPNPVTSGSSSTCGATPAPGFTFTSWSGDCTDTACTLTNVTSAKSVTANFTAQTVQRPIMIGLATRGLAGDEGSGQALIGGLVMEGTGTKRVLFTAKGPSLTAQGISAPLANPQIRVPQITGIVNANDDWTSDPRAVELQQLNRAPSNNRESAMLRTLGAGAYTPIVSGVGGTVGIALMEIYDLSPEVTTLRFRGLATRGVVGTGEQQLIGGLAVQGGGTGQFLFTGKGPSMAAQGLTGLVGNPQLALPQVGNAVNDNWRTNANAQEIINLGSAPTDEREAALLLVIGKGGFTPIISGVNGETGLGLVEIYEKP